MEATIYYTATNVSGYSYDHDEGILDVRHYDSTGEFLRRTYEPAKLHHYTKVGTVDLPLGSLRTVPKNVDEVIPNAHLEKIYHFFNMVKPSEITDAIKNGLETEHSSMSIGDVIEIDNNFFIVARFGFERINLEV